MLHKISIRENDAGQRLDKFLMKFLPDMPKNMLYKLIRKKDIRYNGKRCQGNEILQIQDVITIYAAETFFLSATEKATVPTHAISEAEELPLHICYEDAHFVVVNKPVGQDVHSGSRQAGRQGNLTDAVRHYLYTKREYIPEQEQSFAPAPCNRIDRNTQGLVIVAKNAAALRAMNEAIRMHQVQKQYLAITASPLPKQQDTCTAWLKREAGQKQVKILGTPPDKSWQKICTHYEVIACKQQKQLVKIQLLTGRTHQIRAHMAYLGAYLLGERKYTPKKNHSGNDGNRKHNQNYQCLCAWKLTFSGLTSPLLQYLENTCITAPVPEFVTDFFPEVNLP